MLDLLAEPLYRNHALKPVDKEKRQVGTFADADSGPPRNQVGGASSSRTQPAVQPQATPPPTPTPTKPEPLKIDKDTVAQTGQDKKTADTTSVDYKKMVAAKLLAREPDAWDDMYEIDLKEQAVEFFKHHPFGKLEINDRRA